MMIEREQLEELLATMEKEAGWDLSTPKTWGFVFGDKDESKLVAAADELEGMEYDVIGIHEPDPEEDDDPDMLFLLVERVEQHDIDSLLKRTAELSEFASDAELFCFDGIDVGPGPDDPDYEAPEIEDGVH